MSIELKQAKVGNKTNFDNYTWLLNSSHKWCMIPDRDLWIFAGSDLVPDPLRLMDPYGCGS